jgi:hypothetical protein
VYVFGVTRLDTEIVAREVTEPAAAGVTGFGLKLVTNPAAAD